MFLKGTIITNITFSSGRPDKVLINEHKDVFWLNVSVDDFALSVEIVEPFQKL